MFIYKLIYNNPEPEPEPESPNPNKCSRFTSWQKKTPQKIRGQLRRS